MYIAAGGSEQRAAGPRHVRADADRRGKVPVLPAAGRREDQHRYRGRLPARQSYTRPGHQAHQPRHLRRGDDWGGLQVVVS